MLEAMLAAGIGAPPGGLVPDGKIHRFRPNGRKAPDAWYVFYGDHGAFGDWAGGVNGKWSNGGARLTQSEQQRQAEQIEQERRRRENQERDQQQATAARLTKYWEKLPEAQTTPYLSVKRVKAYGLKQGVNAPETLILPLRDVDGKLWNIQTIDKDGRKLFQEGARKKGCFHLIGAAVLSDITFAYVAEGYATGASLYMATGQPVIVAFDAGNLEPVVTALRERNPKLCLVLAGDDDRWKPEKGNAGRTKAEAMASKFGCGVVFPTFKDTTTRPTDFNDLHILEGLEAVKSQLKNIRVEEKMPMTNSSGLPWPEPDLSLYRNEDIAPPTFDPDSLPPALWAWCQDMAVAKACPVDFVALNLLTVASACLGNARRIAATGDWVEPPHIWGAIVSPPSGGKTPSQQVFTEVCKTLEADASPAWQTQMIDHETKCAFANAKRKLWESDIAKAAKDGFPAPPMPPEAQIPEAPVEPRVLLCESTTQETTNILSRNPKGLLLLRDELSGWLGSFDRYSGAGADRSFYLESWNGGRFSVDLVKNAGKPVVVPYASLAILGGLQPDKLREAMAGADDGLSARFCYVWPRLAPYAPLREEDHIESQKRRDFLLVLVRRLRGLQMDEDKDGSVSPRIVRLSDEAMRLFETARHEAIEKARDAKGLAAGWHGKTPARALRLALTIEYLRWAIDSSASEPHDISAASMAHACTYLDYLEAMFDRVLHGLAVDEAETDAVSIMRFIVNNKADLINERTLYQTSGFGHLRKKAPRQAAFNILERDGWIRRAGLALIGRKRSDWEVNPMVAGGLS